SVEAGVKYSESPSIVQAPASAGLTVGGGDPAAGTPDSPTHSGTVPSTRARSGCAVNVVCGSAATGVPATGIAGAAEGVAALAWWEPPSRPPRPWSRPASATIATAAAAAITGSAPPLRPAPG